MRKAIRFGGRRRSARSRDNIDASLSAVLGQLSWKYVKAQAEFRGTNSFEEIQSDDLRGSIAQVKLFCEQRLPNKTTWSIVIIKTT